MAVDAELEDEIGRDAGAFPGLGFRQIVIAGGADIILAARMRLVAGAQAGRLGEVAGAELVVLARSDAVVEAGLGQPAACRLVGKLVAARLAQHAAREAAGLLL